jgi:hypothetical protein
VSDHSQLTLQRRKGNKTKGSPKHGRRVESASRTNLETKPDSRDNDGDRASRRKQTKLPRQRQRQASDLCGRCGKISGSEGDWRTKFEIRDSGFAGRKREGLDLAIASPAGSRQNRNSQHSIAPTWEGLIRCSWVHVRPRPRPADWPPAKQQTTPGKALSVPSGLLQPATVADHHPDRLVGLQPCIGWPWLES